MISLSIPSFRKVKDETESGYFVYEIHVTKPSGREVTIERRFQEFYQFNKQVCKSVNNPPHFPSTKLPKPLNTNTRFLESRRAALEEYLRNLVSLIEISEVHDLLTRFLETNLPQHIRMQNLDYSRTSSIEDLDGYSVEGPKLTHQPLVCFVRDPFKDNVCSTNALPDVVLQGTLEGLYGNLQGTRVTDCCDRPRVQ